MERRAYQSSVGKDCVPDQQQVLRGASRMLVNDITIYAAPHSDIRHHIGRDPEYLQILEQWATKVLTSATILQLFPDFLKGYVRGCSLRE